MSGRQKIGEREVEMNLDNYKEKILPVNKGRISLQRDLYFLATSQRGYEVEYDVTYQEGCSPTETLLMSLGGCMSIDVVHILRKMRCKVDHYEMTMEGTRYPNPPQYYKSFDFTIRISGKGITPARIERAISLSREKYCSVYHSLRQDIEVNVRYEIE